MIVIKTKFEDLVPNDVVSVNYNDGAFINMLIIARVNSINVNNDKIDVTDLYISDSNEVLDRNYEFEMNGQYYTFNEFLFNDGDTLERVKEIRPEYFV